MPQGHPRARLPVLWRNSVPLTFGGHLQQEMPFCPETQVARERLHTEPYGPEHADK